MDKNKPSETILVIVLGLVVIYWFKRHDWILAVALVIGLVSILAPAAGRGIDWSWRKLSEALGAFSGRVLLTVIYVFVLIPLSFIARRMGKVTLRKKPGGNSYFKERNHTFRKEDFLQPW